MVEILTDQQSHDGARKYWSVLKTRLKQEGNELTTICSQLKMRSADGKYYNTDVANTKGILRIIQSIPSAKVEPFKLWLAEVGNDRINETIDPELAIDRAFATYLRKGYTKEWINQRILALRVRNELTSEGTSAELERVKNTLF